jgi:DNA polymerase-3 subunit delta'
VSATAPAPTARHQPPPALSEATEHQPAARRSLAAALAGGPLHAYLFRGPRGSGKAAAARAFAAELLAEGAPDPDGARRRALADPSPHPDLVWLRPPGAQHLVEDVRELIIKGVSLRPFESARRVFVIEAAEALGEESQNALLKTLEEPAPFAHILLLSAEAEAIAATVRSRCQEVDFRALPPEAIEAILLAGGAGEEEAREVARLCNGDADLARFLVGENGRRLRAEASRCARAAREGEIDRAPWTQLLAGAEAAGAEAGAIVEARLLERAEGQKGPEATRIRREAAEAAKRVTRRERTAAIDLALALCGAEIRAGDPAGAAPALELILDTRRRLRLNVSEELALEALFSRLEEVLAH